MNESLPDDSRGRKADHSVDPLKYATEYHAPVLCNTVVEVLITNPGGIYIDCTLGGGGHTHALLDSLAPEALVVGIDRDQDAIDAATARLSKDIESGRFKAVVGNFSTIGAVADSIGLTQVDGVLFDFGVSSHQIDDPARGFSFRDAGSLDMRMDSTSETTAGDLINTWAAEDLSRLFRQLGEENRGKSIARAIVENLPLESTKDLADVIRGVVRGPHENKTLARIFQALRIFVNAELESIRQALPAATRLVRTGGRCVALSYHSLEDRLIKRYFRFGNFEGIAKKDFYGNIITPWRPLTTRPVTAKENEVHANPRARSARLRAATRLELRD